MMQLQRLKTALIAYVNSVKAVWSKFAHPLSIVSKRKGKVKDYRIYGNSVQDGTPTPEEPIEVQSVGELTTKNLFDIDACLNACLIKNDNGSYTLQKTSSNRFTNRAKISIPANTKFAFGVDVIEYKQSTSFTKNAVYAQLFHPDGTQSAQPIQANVTGTPTSAHHVTSYSKDIVEIRLYMQGDNEVGDYITFKNMQIEIGAERTEYEPYHKYKVPVTVRGKNLLDMSQHTVSQGVYLDNTGTAKANTRFIRISPIAVKPSTQYTLSVGSKYFLYTIWFFSGGDGTGIEKVNAYKLLKKTFTTPDNCNYIRVCLDSYYAGGTALVEDFEWAMLEKGEGDGIYEPYIEPQTHNIYLDEPLRKIGDYADIVDFEKGVVVRKIHEQVFDGDENDSDFSTSLMDNAYVYPIANKLSGQGLCSHFKYEYPLPNASVRYWGGFAISSLQNSGIGFFALNSPFSGLSGLKSYFKEQYLKGIPVRVSYALATPVEESINLPKLPQFKGTTIYEVQTEVPPSGIEVCYYE